jgi:uncharacterized protein YecT (DUF1311 family)
MQRRMWPSSIPGKPHRNTTGPGAASITRLPNIFHSVNLIAEFNTDAPVAAPGIGLLKETMKRLLLIVLLGTSGAAFANSACDRPKNDFDGLYCLNKVYQEADKELNANYQSLSAKLDAAGKSGLKRGQLAWIQTRNKSCSKAEADHFYVDLQCATATTISRAQFLQDRVRECTSAGCQNSKL